MSSPTPTEHPFDRFAWWLLVLAAATATVWFVVLAAQRIPYPHELEWMEGALVDHAARVANGLPIYCPPTPQHVPFLYAPLLFWLGGGLMACGLDGLLALRLVAALSSLGIALLIGHWVRRETGRVGPGLVAAGVFLAGYGWLFWWYDLARNDSPFLLAILGCAYVLRHGGSQRWLAAAALATVAVLAKQSAVMWLPAIGVGALIHDWRNGLKFGFAGVGGIVVSLGILHLSSDGWSTFYLFEMPSHHHIVEPHKVGFWTRDLWPMLPLVGLGLIGFVAGCRAGHGRAALYLAAVGSGGIVTSWFSRMHAGGFDNVLIYGFGIACVLGVSAAAKGRALPALLVVQFGLLFWFDFAPARTRIALPSAAHRQAHEELLAYVRGRPGDVFLPDHGLVSTRAGKAACAHGQAIFDLLQLLPNLDHTILSDPARLQLLAPRAREALESFYGGLMRAMAAKHYAAFVIDQQHVGAFSLWFGMGMANYRERTEPILTVPTALRPPIGHEVDSPTAYELR